MSALPEETIHEIAAGWVARQRSGMMSEQEARDLQVWLDREPGHRAAFEHVEGVWRTSAALRTDPQIMVMRDMAMKAHRGDRRRWLAMGAIAASLAIAVAGGWSLMGGPAMGRQAFSTGVGQTATVTLQDGSIVTLDTDTRLTARETADRRLVKLEKGQAFFRVAKDRSRPFMVTAGGKTITAVGTAFNVRLDGGKVEVILAEGRVKVSGPTAAPKKAPVADMTPGSRLVAAANTDDWQIARIDVGEATSWRIGQLVFVRRPLGEVAEELNRYSHKKIVIEDPGLAHAQITGGFAAGDVDGFVKAVRGYGLAQVASDSDDEVILQPQ